MKTRANVHRKTGRRRVLELMAEVAIAVTLVIGITVDAIYGPKQPSVEDKWIAFAFNGMFVFGRVLTFMRSLWKRPKFWVAMFILILLHVIAGWVLLSGIERVPLVWYVPADVTEIVLVLRVIEWVFGEDQTDAFVAS